MSTQINDQVFKRFFIHTVGSDKISHDVAKKLNIDNDTFDEANDNDNNYIEIDEVFDNKDLYEMFASMCLEEQKNEAQTDQDKEKEEKNKVKNKNGAGAA